MENQNNFDKFIEEKISLNLNAEVSPDFTDKLMREVNMTREFRKEDKKAFRYANAVTMLLLVFVIGAGVTLSYLTSSAGKGDSNGGGFTEFVDKAVSLVNIKLFNILGISLSPEMFFYAAGLIFMVIAFSFVEKVIFRRSSQ